MLGTFACLYRTFVVGLGKKKHTQTQMTVHQMADAIDLMSYTDYINGNDCDTNTCISVFN